MPGTCVVSGISTCGDKTAARDSRSPTSAKTPVYGAPKNKTHAVCGTGRAWCGVVVVGLTSSEALLLRHP